MNIKPLRPHSWGTTFDFAAKHNPLEWGRTRTRNHDWLHVQAARV